jgi:hypothetical protein
MHCGRMIAAPLTRREMLLRCANGFGAVALAALMAEEQGRAGEQGREEGLASKTQGTLASLHHPAKARSVIFLYMDGGPSQMDTFDPKPLLTRENGKPFGEKIEPTQFNNNGATLGSPWKFQQYGHCGAPVSELLPHVAECVDDIAFVRSMTSEFTEHTTANYFLHTGSPLQGRPSMGAWTTYGLGSECRDLPGFVVINGGLIPVGGLDNFGSGYLPATYQGSIFRPDRPAVANVEPSEPKRELQQSKLELLKRLDSQAAEQFGRNDAVESAIGNYELAYRMQMAVPGLMDLSNETPATQKSYGLEADWPQTRVYGRACLLARRLVERGVRFIELTCPGTSGDRWDQHGGLKKGHEENARSVDQPVAALLKDLKARGLLDTTLVVWAGEFGRTPFAQGTDGRDHNPFGYTIWMAGGGVKGGTTFGATDEYGYKAVENKVTIHDLHATMLHLLGVDHTKLTFRFSGRDFRLTDVHGEVMREIIA